MNEDHDLLRQERRHRGCAPPQPSGEVQHHVPSTYMARVKRQPLRTAELTLLAGLVMSKEQDRYTIMELGTWVLYRRSAKRVGRSTVQASSHGQKSRVSLRPVLRKHSIGGNRSPEDDGIRKQCGRLSQGSYSSSKEYKGSGHGSSRCLASLILPMANDFQLGGLRCGKRRMR